MLLLVCLLEVYVMIHWPGIDKGFGVANFRASPKALGPRLPEIAECAVIRLGRRFAWLQSPAYAGQPLLSALSVRRFH